MQSWSCRPCQAKAQEEGRAAIANRRQRIGADSLARESQCPQYSWAICGAGIAADSSWSPNRVTCLHHLHRPDKALNDRAKEGFIRIKAEPDERPVVCHVSMLLERPHYWNLSLVVREGESSKWWAISGSKCLSCQMRPLCGSINSSKCFHLCVYIS